MSDTAIIMIAAVVAAALVAGLFAASRLYRRLDEGAALIVTAPGGKRVVFAGGAWVLPLVHHAERMDLSVKAIAIDRRGRDGIVCRDNIRADVRAVFVVRVNRTAEDVLRVASSLGCAQAASLEVLTQLFVAKFTEALAVVGKQLEFEELCDRREEFKDRVVEAVGRDLAGFVLDDVAIEHLEQTPLDALDPDNIFDAEAIRKITERTARESVRVNELRQRERLDILAQNVAADAEALRREQRRAEAEVRREHDITAHRW